MGERPVVVDEVQRAGDALVRAIKLRVDDDPSPGQYILTGSSNFLTVPTLSESLGGRAAFVDLWPFTQGEIAGSPERFLDDLFADPGFPRQLAAQRLSIPDYLERICAGGYPEVQGLDRAERPRWFGDYVRTTVQRDIVELSGIRKVDALHQLLRLFAARTAQELVMTSVIEDSQLERQAVYDHTAWLQTVHLLDRVPAWSRNLTARVKRRPKVYVTDPGLAAWLLGKDVSALAEPTEPSTGALVETFVVTEILRQLTWAETEVSVHHWRDRDGREADLVLEASDGRVVGVQIKRGATANAQWFRGLRLMRDKLDEVGDSFLHGVVFYSGTEVVPFGDRMTAVPIASLWDP